MLTLGLLRWIPAVTEYMQFAFDTDPLGFVIIYVELIERSILFLSVPAAHLFEKLEFH